MGGAREGKGGQGRFELNRVWEGRGKTRGAHRGGEGTGEWTRNGHGRRDGTERGVTTKLPGWMTKHLLSASKPEGTRRGWGRMGGAREGKGGQGRFELNRAWEGRGKTRGAHRGGEGTGEWTRNGHGRRDGTERGGDDKAARLDDKAFALCFKA